MMLTCRWLAALVLGVALAAGEPGAGPTTPGVAAAELEFRIPAGATRLETEFHAVAPGPHVLHVEGLRAGGAVVVLVDDEPRDAELVADDDPGPASGASVSCRLAAGRHTLAVREEPGLQFYRVRQTNRYLATGTEYDSHPVFRLDLDARNEDDPVEVRFGPQFQPFFRFSGKWGRYSGQTYTQEVDSVATSSGAESASLRLRYIHPPKNLVMPTSFTLERDQATGNVVLRVNQMLMATGVCTWGDHGNLEFLHVDLSPKHGRDWEDGVPDYFWNREQADVDPDTLTGLRTHFALYDDNSRRCFPYRSSTRDPRLTRMSKPNHTAFAHPLYAENTIAGWFTKTGTGCIGLVMHTYKSSFASDISPVHGHCGDGADTHFYAGWGQLYLPWVLAAGDWVKAEYTLQCLPSEVLREQIERINEFDLAFFGEERAARSAIVRWYGTRHAVGLVRSDGSAVILGIGTADSVYPLPDEALRKVVSVFRLSELAHCNWEDDLVRDGCAVVRPGWVTVVDCGSALDGPLRRIPLGERLQRQVLRLFGAEAPQKPGRR